MSFNYTSFQEIITLLAWSKSGGLELSTNGLGYLLGGSNLFLLFFQKWVYLFLAKKYGNYLLSIYCLIVLPIITTVLPATSLISSIYLKYSALFLLCIAWYLIEFLVFTAILVLLNNSVPRSELGKLNGFAMSLNCIARMLAPASMGATFALFIKSWLPQPLNYSFSFYILAGIELVALFFTYKINKENEESYKDNQDKKLSLIELEIQ